MAPPKSAPAGAARWLASSWRRVAAVLGLAALLAVPALTAQAADPTAQAAALSAPDARAVRATVEAQLAAFAAGDAERAYSYASDAIQRQFGDADRFLAMVQSAYPMIVGPAGVAFLVAQAADDGVVQQVRLRDAAGRSWLATYALERAGAGGWRIGGCVVRPASEQSFT